MTQPELKETLQDPQTDGLQSIWLVEEGGDAKARQEMIKVLLSSDIEFRKLRRIVRTLFDKSVQKGYADRGVDQFELGYRAALQELYKLIPVTRSE